MSGEQNGVKKVRYESMCLVILLIYSKVKKVRAMETSFGLEVRTVVTHGKWLATERVMRDFYSTGVQYYDNYEE